MEILCKNNIGICFSSGFSSVGSTIISLLKKYRYI